MLIAALFERTQTTFAQSALGAHSTAEAGDNEHTYGNTNFAPVYTYYNWSNPSTNTQPVPRGWAQLDSHTKYWANILKLFEKKPENEMPDGWTDGRTVRLLYAILPGA
ncbi:hypothetical protein DPMN_136165 [Dreissena polymorpha]|uniref:Uncharacterized protein n=1 Tax=Dreissena polymorpha TaxID=45954 RepID=A0A9D4JFA6_DREPO|nr:hypothetical protein DPMN_136162 [Dreissena polymorpha]KAH3807817.1 hypothetical protein DPMN_136165 [Dreissena polymorpha]